MNSSRILLLTGQTGSGKTSTLKKLLPELKSSGIRAGGILAPGRLLASGEKEFDLELIPGPGKYFLSSRTPADSRSGWQPIGGFYFNPEAVDKGLQHLRSLPGKQFQLYLLDEIGPFELKGLLWAQVIPDLLATGTPMIWTVRKRILELVLEKWGLQNVVVVYLEHGDTEKTKEQIGLWIKKTVQA